ncbi:hypothetical protein BC937DRAFT_88096 [Endogone sp. FLAS-F59071]|nr:hypothetical protein BC937DRAFT_88096 [Endogone sp. FLAS-F59071]|eukprot:RUS18988.1 hypothetical protein BC937DRAFT_88096 [Endogone sp. FLAS-F59071]
MSAPNYDTVVLDIEGTTTPITFVKDILVSIATPLRLLTLSGFPSNPNHRTSADALVRSYSSPTSPTASTAFSTRPGTQQNSRSKFSYCANRCLLYIYSAAKDVAEGLSGAVLIPEETSSNTNDVKRAISQNIKWQVAADRKIGALKSFQGYMWQGGFESGVIRSM